MDLIKLYKKRRYIIKTAVLVLIIIIAGIFYINPTKEDGSVIINKDNISDKESDSKSIIGELPAAVLLILTIVMVLMVTKQAMTDWMRITVRYMYIYVVQLLMQELSVVVQV